MGSTELTQKPHAVCIPFPAQSHIKAMLNLAKLLHHRGFHVTFVNTEYNHSRLLRSRGPASLDGLPSFQFRAIPYGLPPDKQSIVIRAHSDSAKNRNEDVADSTRNAEDEVNNSFKYPNTSEDLLLQNRYSVLESITE